MVIACAVGCLWGGFARLAALGWRVWGWVLGLMAAVRDLDGLSLKVACELA